MSNFDLWASTSETDPAYVKQGQRGMSSIDGYYFFMLATKQFGPCGIGWGYEILEERVDVAEPLFNGEGEQIDATKNHTLKVKLWYELGGKRGEIVNYGHTRLSMKTKNGLMVDEEAPKKSLTDALKKCLSMLGFCSDVYMGKHEDHRYTQEVANKKAVENAIDKDAEKARQAKELTEEAERVIEQITAAKSISELQGLYTAIIRKLNNKDAGLIRKVEQAKDTKKEELSND